MRIYSNHKTLLTALLLLSFAVGCCSPGSNPNAGNPVAQQTPPTVLSVIPSNATPVCTNIAIISATFSKAMNPATINSPATNFTLTDQSGASVPGTVTYVVATDIATFTPTNSLAASATYTATITTGAADTFGNTLAADYPWTVATSAACSTSTQPLPPGVTPGHSPLGTACSFGILGATPSVTNTGLTTVSGDIGISPAASITGFPPGTYNGYSEFAGPGTAATAQHDLGVEYAYLMALAPTDPVSLPADLTGLTLKPGVYFTGSTEALTGALYLDGSSDPNCSIDPTCSWVFQIPTALTTPAGGPTTVASNSYVHLENGAQANNVFWVVGSAATLGTYTTFAGNILASATVTLDTGASLNGRAMSTGAAVTLDTNQITMPTTVYTCP